MVQWVKALAVKAREPEFKSEAPLYARHTCHPSTGDGEGRQVDLESLQASLAKTVSF